ncbi:Rne/Rng family ribonuclease [Phenylobacterium immobile]|uniref:Rne/Rng family ribonuclease n=1 Tax=Phenylobacterium immobile TaxID=21 RepID=UPI000A8A07D5|nr:ribonuclease E/G [Phenylobacterium immobile]
MTKTMLIDAAHAEETRVVVIDGSRIEEFDFESQNRKQLRGNIYLAKVTRVEPSLQAAFIEYGGNRHGFLAFNEIHPDYYQIPLADREALMREEADDEDDHHEPRTRNGGGEDDEDGDVDTVADDDEDDVDEELARRKRRLMRRYKIQEVIRRRQIMLVQVVKEERGNKGAALTTYLSLAGRYGVLMPNTARGGGISRKITAVNDRKRLKSVVQSLEVPQGMGLIVRTAGAKRTKTELKRDYDYLLRLWENIREKTLHSIAPALIYEEEDLVKRAIRDLYDKDIDGVIVEGEASFKAAHDFMRMLMPSQAKKVQPHREPTPLFMKFGIEDHLDQIYSPVVPLRSGGYLVINQTEALVAIDVNSGRATRERNIEATALKTNMEAAEEAARQMRLRDLAGLVVIDFIDMDESKNNRSVEKKMKDCLADDRARVQMGKISTFGLMEISRQRRRAGVLEGTTHVCEHCGGTGRVRSVESSALSALRAVEQEAKNGGGEATLSVPRAVALYILNEKRGHLARLHQAFGLFVTIVVDDALAHAESRVERTAAETTHAPIALAAATAPIYNPVDEDYDDEEEVEDEDEDEDDEEVEDELVDEADEDGAVAVAPARRDAEDTESGRRNGRRNRRRNRGERGEPKAFEAAPEGEVAGEADDDGGFGRRRRRGRRGGRRMRDETRPNEMFAWIRPWVPYGEDPFVWYDPAEDLRRALQPEVSAQPAPSPTPVEAPAPAAASIAANDRSDVDIWVELPAEEEKPKASRSRGRGRRRGGDKSPAEETVADIPAEAVITLDAPAMETVLAPVIAEAETVDVVEAASEEASDSVPAPARRARKPRLTKAAAAAAAAALETQPEPQPEPEPVAQIPPEPEPVSDVVALEAALVPVVDPNEISSAPATPRRGWWRCG